jgi:hypothetical protein
METIKLNKEEGVNDNDIRVVIEETKEVVQNKFNGSINDLDMEVMHIDTENDALNVRKTELFRLRDLVVTEIAKPVKKL